jgi:hypothetical protein
VEFTLVVSSVPDLDSPDPPILGFPDPDPLVRGMDLSSSKKNKKNLDSYRYCFVTSFGLFIFENDINLPSKSNKQKTLLKKIKFLLAS